MGSSWSDILYPDNPKRREQVADLANHLRSDVEAVYTHCVTMSTMLHLAYEEFSMIPLIDLGKTYKDNFDVLTATFAQWAKVTEHLSDGEEVTAEIRQLIDDINKASDEQGFSEHVNAAIEKVSGGAFLSSKIVAVIAGAVASRYAYIAIVPLVVDGAVGVALSFFGAAIAGAAVGIVVESIIAAIDGARERGELEDQKAKLQEAIDKIAPAAKALQTEVANVCLSITQVMVKQPRTASF